MKYFRREKYQVAIVSKENFEEWKSQNPQYASIDFQKFKKYWRHIREGIFQGAIENPEGVDLPFFLGNLSIKILDIDFKCAKDFNKSILTNKETGEKVKVPFVTSDIPKKPKITWKKHKLFGSLASLFGVEMAKTAKIVMSGGMRNNLKHYHKAFHHDKVPSKCEDTPVKSLFDSV